MLRTGQNEPRTDVFGFGDFDLLNWFVEKKKNISF